MDIDINYKKVKNITLRIKPDGTVSLTVPFGISKDRALRFARSKEKWIEEKLWEIQNNKEKIKKVNYITGDQLYYLGKKYTLVVKKSSSPCVDIKGENIEISVDNVDDYEGKEEILHKWYMEKAKVVFSDYVEKWEGILNQRVKSITIRCMKTRWGSCNQRLHKINLNLDLIRKDVRCIDYVILHEIAHITHPNHSEDFWNYVEKYMKDYKEVRKTLKG